MLTCRDGVSPLLKAADRLFLHARDNMKKINRIRVGSEKKYGPRPVGEILNNYLNKINSPLATAYRERLLKDLHPNTEPCVDLKLYTREPGRMPVGTYINCVMVHDSEERYTCIEDSLEEKKVTSVLRSPHLYKGSCVNVVRRADGNLYPMFTRPQYSKDFTFKDFCREAAEELLATAGLVEKE